MHPRDDWDLRTEKKAQTPRYQYSNVVRLLSKIYSNQTKSQTKPNLYILSF